MEKKARKLREAEEAKNNRRRRGEYSDGRPRSAIDLHIDSFRLNSFAQAKHWMSTVSAVC